MKTVEPTLGERASYMYRLLVLLQQVFQASGQMEDVDWLATGNSSRDLALCGGIREQLEELAKHARILAGTPFPISDWRPGDGPDDERWRGLTEIETREVLAMLSNYESLLAWSERLVGGPAEFVGRGSGDGPVAIFQARSAPRGAPDDVDYLKDHRAQLDRFRRELGFLERQRRSAQ